MTPAEISLGQTFTIGLDAPSANPLGADFVLFGFVGSLDAATRVTTPWGHMTFAPAWASPGQAQFFALASSFNPPPAPAILQVHPAPWTSPFITIPVPLTFSLQALVDEGGGSIAVSNAVEIRIG